LQPDEFGDVFEILSEDEALASGDDRYVAHAELQQALAAARVVEDVDRFEIDAFTRKKLFRPKTAASTRLCEERELFGDGVHGESFVRESGKPTPDARSTARSARARCYNGAPLVRHPHHR
jgi:hypothetical protein